MKVDPDAQAHIDPPDPPAPSTSTPPPAGRGRGLRLAAIAVMCAALLGGSWGLYAWLQDYRTRMQHVGYPIHAFVLPDLHAPERTLRAADLGGEPFLLHSFASWCPACAAGHHDTTQLARRYRLRLIGYNLEDQRENALGWLQKMGDPYTRIVADRDGEVALYGLRMYGTPFFVLVDADGIIRWRHQGTLTEDTIAQGLEPALRAMGHTP